MKWKWKVHKYLPYATIHLLSKFKYRESLSWSLEISLWTTATTTCVDGCDRMLLRLRWHKWDVNKDKISTEIKNQGIRFRFVFLFICQKFNQKNTKKKLKKCSHSFGVERNRFSVEINFAKCFKSMCGWMANKLQMNAFKESFSILWRHGKYGFLFRFLFFNC